MDGDNLHLFHFLVREVKISVFLCKLFHLQINFVFVKYILEPYLVMNSINDIGSTDLFITDIFILE